MAQSTPKTDDSAEQAYAAAAEVAKPAAKAAPAKKAPVKKAAPAKKVVAASAKPVAKKAVPNKAAPKKAPAAKKTVAKKTPAPKRTASSGAKAAKTEPTVTQLKEKIMATKTNDFSSQITETMTQAVNEVQTRTQAAYDKGTEAMTEMAEFAKGNVEAVVETGKVFAEGVQGMGQTFADEAKLAYETATADIKDMASIKSPTELFQLQGTIMRRNFDAMIAAASKTTDATMKMANDVAAPVSARVNLAAEKLSKVA